MYSCSSVSSLKVVKTDVLNFFLGESKLHLWILSTWQKPLTKFGCNKKAPKIEVGFLGVSAFADVIGCAVMTSQVFDSCLLLGSKVSIHRFSITGQTGLTQNAD